MLARLFLMREGVLQATGNITPDFKSLSMEDSIKGAHCQSHTIGSPSTNGRGLILGTLIVFHALRSNTIGSSTPFKYRENLFIPSLSSPGYPEYESYYSFSPISAPVPSTIVSL
jgi:hypothetical protein